MSRTNAEVRRSHVYIIIYTLAKVIITFTPDKWSRVSARIEIERQMWLTAINYAFRNHHHLTTFIQDRQLQYTERTVVVIWSCIFYRHPGILTSAWPKTLTPWSGHPVPAPTLLRALYYIILYMRECIHNIQMRFRLWSCGVGRNASIMWWQTAVGAFPIGRNPYILPNYILWLEEYILLRCTPQSCI